MKKEKERRWKEWNNKKIKGESLITHIIKSPYDKPRKKQQQKSVKQKSKKTKKLKKAIKRKKKKKRKRTKVNSSLLKSRKKKKKSHPKNLMYLSVSSSLAAAAITPAHPHTSPNWSRLAFAPEKKTRLYWLMEPLMTLDVN